MTGPTTPARPRVLLIQRLRRVQGCLNFRPPLVVTLKLAQQVADLLAQDHHVALGSGAGLDRQDLQADLKGGLTFLEGLLRLAGVFQDFADLVVTDGDAAQKVHVLRAGLQRFLARQHGCAVGLLGFIQLPHDQQLVADTVERQRVQTQGIKRPPRQVYHPCGRLRRLLV